MVEDVKNVLIAQSKRARPDAIRFLGHLIGWITVALILGKKDPRGDSYHYLMILPDDFYTNGQFDPLRFSSDLRGYTLPFVALIIREFSDAFSLDPDFVVLFFAATVFAVITALLLPKIFKVVVPRVNANVLSIVFALFMLIFWNGHLQYLLSDVPALASFLLATYWLIKPVNYFRAIGIGLFGYLSINIRPSYIFGFIAVIVILLIRAWCARPEQKFTSKALFTSLISVCLLAGFLILALPQLQINRNLSGTKSFLPKAAVGSGEYQTPDGPITVGAPDLKIFQLSVGLGLQKYETRIEPGEDPRVPYMDDQGMRIVREYLPISTASDYARLWQKEPVTMASIYTRHVINGLDLRHNTPYTASNTEVNVALRALWYAIIGIALFIVGHIAIFRKKSLFSMEFLPTLLVVTLAAVASTIPGAVETRFFILPSLVIIGIAATCLSVYWKELFASKKTLMAMCLFALIVGVFFLQYSQWLESTRGIYPLRLRIVMW